MFIVLIPVFYVLLWTFFASRQPEKNLRATFLKTTLLIFAFAAAATEILSLFRSITADSLIFVWLAANLALFIDVRRKIRFSPRRALADFREKIAEIPVFYLSLLILIYSVILVLALFSPPNTHDSMTYHLARVANWIQFGAVEFYPTAIIRQLYQPPLAEYALLHLQLLSGGDYFANLLQWFSLVSIGVVVSLITREFGQDFKTQTLAALLSALLPAAIVQGSSTQNDLIAALFILAFFYWWTRAVKSNSRADFLWTGIALGLAVLTKGTAYIFCLPIGVIFTGLHFYKHPGRWLSARRLAAVLIIAVVFNIGHYARNYRLFGAPVSTAGDAVRNESLTPKMFFANLARNYAIHLGTYSEDLRLTLEEAMRTAFGDELKNPASTWSANVFRVTYSTHEDLTGNLIHTLLLTLLLPLVFFFRNEEKSLIRAAAFSVFFGFVLFSLLLKWQIYGSRLQIPLFFLGCALSAACLARFLPRTITPVLVIAFIFSLPPLFLAEPRGVLTDDFRFGLTDGTRREKFFRNSGDSEALFTEAADFVKEQKSAPEAVGLMLNVNDLEYPLWFLLKDDFRQKPLIYHVGVENASSKLVGSRPLPEFIISTRNENIVEGVEYREVWNKKRVRILQKSGAAAN
ncbi:MAG TPA: glycosyltransferase family 39 protein [Pyrinomonadaceae bacterium]|jgi:4-amino-4-deoxy-L-arabinose transferase-like glycosyltransferase